MKRVLMILTSHRLDCLKLAMDLLDQGGSFQRFDHVVLLLNGVEGKHKNWIDRFTASKPDVPWDFIAGPRGRGERISSLQNQCVERYPDALYFKMDEDTFVSKDWVDRLLRAYEAHKDDPGLSLITPVIPNSGVGCHHLLKRYPALERQYREVFSYPIVPDCDGPVWIYPQIASWITRKFLDLDRANRRLRTDNPEPFVKFSFRFSINCIAYDYRHWQEVGGVPMEDEVGWGDWIPQHGKYVVLATDSLVHHYSFFVQQDWLDRTSLLEDIRAANLPETLSSSDWLRYTVPRWTRILRQVPRALRRRRQAKK